MTTPDGDHGGVDIARPGQPGYEAATQVFNLAAPTEPAEATTASTVDEVRAAVAHAKGVGRKVRVHSTGHGSASSRPMPDSLLVRTKLAGGVEIDTERRTARVPAGTTWAEVIEAAAPHDLAAPHGSSGLVGVVGYLLRGGVSFYGRSTGLAVNSVRAVELVTADGEARRVDATNDPELFWALRGGGGGLGVVTAVEIDLFPATTVVTGATYWPAAHAGEILSRWLCWAPDAPWAVTSTLRVMNLPDLPVIPPELRDGTVICVDGAVLADGQDPAAPNPHVEDLLAPLRAVAEPLMDTWHPDQPPGVALTHMDPVEPFPIYGDHMLLGELDDNAAERFLRLVGEGSESPLVNAELRQLGGALSEPVPHGGALDHLPASYAYMGGGPPFGPVTVKAIMGHCAAVREALALWNTGLTSPTFIDHHEQPQRHLSPERVAAVDEIRLRVDPTGLFRDDISHNATALS